MKKIKFANVIAWLIGVIVTIVIANGMISKTLSIPTWLGGATVIGSGITVVAGWIILVLVIIGAILAIIGK